MMETGELQSIGTTEATILLISRIIDFLIQLDFENNPFWAMVQFFLLMGAIYLIGCIVVPIAASPRRH